MGIKRLKSYFLDNGHTAKTNLHDAANAWRAIGGNPVLLVDCLNIVNCIVDYRETLCLGGENPEYEFKVEEIINAFKDISIELRFLVDGSVSGARLDGWKRRRIEKMYCYQKDFDKIPIRKVGYFAESRVFPFLAIPVVKETAKTKCVVLDTEGDPDLAMVQYVIDNKCLGIISEDTDFLVFEDIPHIFFPRDIVYGICRRNTENGFQFNPKTLKATEYRRTEFINSIGLISEAFPIFATLAGNDFVEYSDITEYFKRKFRSVKLSEVVRDLAVIANDIYTESGGDQETAALRLAIEIYQTGDSKNCMLLSLQSYDWRSTGTVITSPVGSTDEKWNQHVHRLLGKGIIDPGIARCLLLQLYTLSERFEDKRNPCGILLRDLRRRLYGIILHEKSGEREYVEECIATVPQYFESKRRTLVSTVVVGVPHPGMWALMTDDNKLDGVRWKLMWWAICSPEQESTETVSYDRFINLTNLRDALKLSGLSVFFLFKIVKQISKHEASILMLMTCALLEYTHEFFRKFSMVDEFTTKRACSLATLYQQTLQTMASATLKTCGLKIKCKTSQSYSGHFFHWLMKFEDINQVRDEFSREVWEMYSSFSSILQSSL